MYAEKEKGGFGHEHSKMKVFYFTCRELEAGPKLSRAENKRQAKTII